MKKEKRRAAASVESSVKSRCKDRLRRNQYLRHGLQILAILENVGGIHNITSRGTIVLHLPPHKSTRDTSELVTWKRKPLHALRLALVSSVLFCHQRLPISQLSHKQLFRLESNNPKEAISL